MLQKVMVMVVALVASVFSYSYTCFPPMTGAGKFAVNPVVFMDGKNSGGMESFFYYGMTDDLDISTSILTVGGVSEFSTGLRYSVGDMILGVKANPSYVLPHVSYNWEDERFIMQGMVGLQDVYDYSDKPAIFGSICPGVKICEELNFCLDLNPGYYMQEGDFANGSLRTKGFGFDVAPSIGLMVGDCLFSIAVPVYNVQSSDRSVTFGAWIYYGIGGK